MNIFLALAVWQKVGEIWRIKFLLTQIYTQLDQMPHGILDGVGHLRHHTPVPDIGRFRHLSSFRQLDVRNGWRTLRLRRFRQKRARFLRRQLHQLQFRNELLWFWDILRVDARR